MMAEPGGLLRNTRMGIDLRSVLAIGLMAGVHLYANMLILLMIHAPPLEFHPTVPVVHNLASSGHRRGPSNELFHLRLIPRKARGWLTPSAQGLITVQRLQPVCFSWSSTVTVSPLRRRTSRWDPKGSRSPPKRADFPPLTGGIDPTGLRRI
ncbi:MAG: hypothetical protein HY650_15125 [Acidobacteria bacterium]|nr:hypothetical protein [Acidobacteriota bacterium]